MKKCITTVYYLVANFCKIYQEFEKSKLLPSDRQRQREGCLSLCELLTIVLYFYLSPCKDFKNYYLYHLQYKYQGYFTLPSYSRIIQLWPRLILPLVIMMQYLKGEETGIYFIDSTKLSICHNKRTNSNRVFKRIAKVGMSSYGWFMGFTKYLGQSFGNASYVESQESLSYGSHEMRDGVSFSKAEKTKLLVTPDDIANLNDLECYVNLPIGSIKAVKIKMRYEKPAIRLK